MGAYLARRLLALLPTMLLASLIVFVTIRLIPGDVIDLMLSQNDVAADKLSRDQLVAALGLDQPVRLAVPALGRRDRAARRPGQVAVAEHAGHRAAAGAAAGHLRARRAGAAGRPGDRAADRHLLGAAPGHGGRLPRALVLDPVAGGAQLLAGHHGDGVPVDLVGLVARGELRALRRRPAAEPEADGAAGDRAGRVAVGDHDADDAHHDARGAAPGLHPHRLGQGPAASGWWWCAMRCATRWCRW